MALDLSKAFDTIDHQILLNKLIHFDFGFNTITFIRNYLQNRTFVVRTNDNLSDLCRIVKGVPQGSILGPLLFTLYINDLPKVVEESGVVLYADDSTLFASSKYPANIQISLNNDLGRLDKWFKQNKLNLNSKKSEFLLVSNPRIKHRFSEIKIEVGGNQLAVKDHIKMLGVTLSEDLSWERHTKILIGNLRHRFRSYHRSCSMLTMDSRKLLYNAAIASRLNYCDIIWDECRKSSKNKLQTIQNRCARSILSKQPGTTAMPLIRELGWLDLNEKRKLHKCVMLHQLLLGNGPQLLTELATSLINTNGRNTRGTSNENLILLTHNTNYMTKSFLYNT